MDTAAGSFFPEDKRPLKIIFQDEGRFGRICKASVCWAPKGLRPTVKAQIIREYTHVFSATCPNDGQSVSLILPYADTNAMKIFMEEVSQQLKAYRVIMVMDGAAWHKSKQLGEFENIRTVYLPPYSPELNPVEHLWEHIREKYLRNSFWQSIEELEKILEKILQEISKSLKTVQSLVGFKWAIL